MFSFHPSTKHFVSLRAADSGLTEDNDEALTVEEEPQSEAHDDGPKQLETHTHTLRKMLNFAAKWNKSLLCREDGPDNIILQVRLRAGVLTKKMRLKRNRKYLVAFMQPFPMMLYLQTRGEGEDGHIFILE